MSERSIKQTLRNLSPLEIRPNPENPRIIFRQEEMESLMLSIDRRGIQVPITVYRDGDHYTLIDGERRWRCAQKLNLRTIPALIQEKPSELENLVLMYNIHALREQWDYYTIASKLERIMSLYYIENNYYANEIILSELTGLTRGAIRRCQLLIDLPPRFKSMLMEELDRPKAQQRLSEDFFIEMERSLKTVINRIPEYEVDRDKIRDVLIGKFKSKLIAAVTDFRQLSKIATSINGLGNNYQEVKISLDKIFDPSNKESIREIYDETVQFGYAERKISRFSQSLSVFIDDVLNRDLMAELDEDLVESLSKLHDLLSRMLGR